MASKRGPKGRNAGAFTKGDPRINRAGVPSEINAFRKALREAFAAELEQKVAEHEMAPTRFQEIVGQVVAKAMKGEDWAVKECFDRMGGKPTVVVEAGGPGGGPVPVAILSYVDRPRRNGHGA